MINVPVFYLPFTMDFNVFKELRKVPEFVTVPDEQLQWLADHGTVKRYSDGDKVFTIGDSIDSFQIVFKGGLTLYLNQGNGQRNLGTYEPLEILGRLPYSRMKAAAGEGVAEGELTMFALHRDHFPELINKCHEITEVLVHNMTDRVRDFTKQQQQNDKMMALGKLSAGLAHELNNPSAAVVRSAQELKKHLSHAPQNFKRIMKINASDDVVDVVNSLIYSKINTTASTQSLKEKTALEDSVTEWLADIGMEDVYDLAEVLAEFRITSEDLDTIKKVLRLEDLVPVMGWIGQVLSTEKLVNEIEEASRRINALVTSIKGYTHMDQASEKQLADIHPGIRNTLTMLGHKLKKNNTRYIENFDANLPKVKIYISELNQVWTNVIDNALDAMENTPGSTLEIKTQRDREFAVIYITDNGPGISQQIQDKVFDPFFTTKPIGKGTGLGLEVVRQIINQHNGKIELHSEPGRTEFKICIPIQ